MPVRLVWFVGAWLFSTQFSDHANAELTVIYDNGKIKPLAPFLEVLSKRAKAAAKPVVPSPPDEKTLPMQLPFSTPELSPGMVETRTVSQNPAVKRMPAFFLIGTDSGSRQWLAHNARHLKNLAAVGMLVEAKTESDLDAIAELAPGLVILPAPASDIASALGLKHVPVLVADGVIEQ